MTESMKKFLEQISENEALAPRMENASKDDVIAIAKEVGITLTDADFEQAGEISDDELTTVAGGEKCYCVVGGAGSGDGNVKTCACVIYGNGYHDRCDCIVNGYGQCN